MLVFLREREKRFLLGVWGLEDIRYGMENEGERE